MKHFSTRLADFLIRVLFILYIFLFVFFTMSVLAWTMGFNPLDIPLDIVEIEGVGLDSVPFPPFLFVLITNALEILVTLYILFLANRILRDIRAGSIFSLELASKFKKVAYWIMILFLLDWVGSFMCSVLAEGAFSISIGFDSLFVALLVTIIYITADIIMKGAELRAENELTI